MPEMQPYALCLVSRDLHTLLAGYSVKTKQEYKKLRKHEIHNIFTKTNYINLAFNMIRVMETLWICQKEQLLI